VGDTGPGGGKVFYVNNSAALGARYMEAAPSGWFGTLNVTPDAAFRWGSLAGVVNCSNTSIAGAVGTAIGNGLANTNAITAACATEVQAPAAWAARNYTGGGLAVGSWFLPSRDELNALFLQKTVVGGTVDNFYWSSSQNDSSGARRQTFASGGQNSSAKSNSFLVRPVRAF